MPDTVTSKTVVTLQILSLQRQWWHCRHCHFKDSGDTADTVTSKTVVTPQILSLQRQWWHRRYCHFKDSGDTADTVTSKTVVTPQILSLQRQWWHRRYCHFKDSGDTADTVTSKTVVTPQTLSFQRQWWHHIQRHFKDSGDTTFNVTSKTVVTPHSTSLQRQGWHHRQCAETSWTTAGTRMCVRFYRCHIRGRIPPPWGDVGCGGDILSLPTASLAALQAHNIPYYVHLTKATKEIFSNDITFYLLLSNVSQKVFIVKSYV